MKDNFEDDYHSLLDDVDPDDIKILGELTADVGLQEAFWDLYQNSKDVLDFFGRHEFSDEIKHGLCSLIYHLEMIKDEYEERLEKNTDLVDKLETLLFKVPDSFFELIHDEAFEAREFNISPMNVTKKRAIGYAQSIKNYYEQNVHGKSLGVLDSNTCREHLSILCVLNGIFGMDVLEEDEEADPLVSITYPLKNSYQTVCDELEDLSEVEK